MIISVVISVCGMVFCGFFILLLVVDIVLRLMYEKKIVFVVELMLVMLNGMKFLRWLVLYVLNMMIMNMFSMLSLISIMIVLIFVDLLVF